MGLTKEKIYKKHKNNKVKLMDIDKKHKMWYSNSVRNSVGQGCP